MFRVKLIKHKIFLILIILNFTNYNLVFSNNINLSDSIMINGLNVNIDYFPTFIDNPYDRQPLCEVKPFIDSIDNYVEIGRIPDFIFDLEIDEKYDLCLVWFHSKCSSRKIILEGVTNYLSLSKLVKDLSKIKKSKLAPLNEHISLSHLSFLQLAKERLKEIEKLKKKH